MLILNPAHAGFWRFRLMVVDCRHQTGSRSMVWKILLVVVSAIVGIFVLGAIRSNDPEWMEKQRAKTAIELCRDEAKKHANSSAALSIIIPTCEKFEREYREKYRSNP